VSLNAERTVSFASCKHKISGCSAEINSHTLLYREEEGFSRKKLIFQVRHFRLVKEEEEEEEEEEEGGGVGDIFTTIVDLISLVLCDFTNRVIPLQYLH
jgi:hypothetical protein